MLLISLERIRKGFGVIDLYKNKKETKPPSIIKLKVPYTNIIYIGKVRTIKKIEDSRGREVPIGTVFDAWEDQHCIWGFMLKFNHRKTLVGFYDKRLFEKIEKEGDRFE